MDILNDVTLLSRIQFALTIMFHYLFPPLTIGLSVIMVIIEGLYLKTGKIIYEQMAKFWTRLFAANFALGVASGIVMEFQFGTNWATYSRFVGDVFGSPLAAEGIFAFFLESVFLALLVFGWNRLSPIAHFFSTLMVSLGAIFSAVWIVVANSWQQTPTGHHIVQHGAGFRAEIIDFWAMVFNPSAVTRLIHVLLACLNLGSFFVMSICAYYILKKQHTEFAKKSFKIALFVGLFASFMLPIVGHKKAQIVAKYQPAKLAAFEGHFKSTSEGTPLYITGIPNTKTEQMDYGIAIPNALSFLVHGNTTTPIPGLDQFAKEDRPPVLLTFLSYRLMIMLGVFFMGILLVALYYYIRGTLFEQTWLLWTFVVAVLGSYTANMAGWVAAEVGRQPWIVYNLLRTSDGVSKSITASQVLSSIIMFSCIYALLFFVWIYVMNHKVHAGPDLSYKERPKQLKGERWFTSAALWADPSHKTLTNPDAEDNNHGS